MLLSSVMMTNNPLFLFLITTLLLSLFANADVNMRDAAFVKNVQDLPHPLLQKNYNSRSLWHGAFGFGWCSRLESKLETPTAGPMILKNCDWQTRVLLQKKKTYWVHHTSQGDEIYNHQGQLIEWSRPRTQISYDPQGRVLQLITAREKWSFEYQGNSPQIVAIRSSQGTRAQYRYDKEDLVEIATNTRLQMQMRYDSLHNLVNIRSPWETEKITYQTDKDEVASYQSSRSICEQIFDFQKISDTQLRSSVDRRCASARQRLRTWDFRARRDSQGKLILSEVSTTAGGDVHVP